MKWVFDLDGVITANPEFFRTLIYFLRKNEHEVYILTARNPRRKGETLNELKKLGIEYDQIFTMDGQTPRGGKNLGEWKIKLIRDLGPDFWFENELKHYRELGVDTDLYMTQVIVL